MDELLEQFLIEGRDLVVQAGDDCAALVKDGGARPVIDSAFRAIHTLKGSAGIVGLAPMEAMLHAAEDLLGEARSAGRPVSRASAEALVACIDQCDRWLDAVAAGGLPGDAAAVAARIGAGLHRVEGENAPEPEAPVVADDGWAQALLRNEAVRVADGAARTAVRYVPREDCFFAGDDPLALVGSIPDLLAVEVRVREPWPALESFDPYRCLLSIDALSGAEAAQARAVFRLIPDQVQVVEVTAPERVAVSAAGQGAAEQTVRVEARQVDRLLDLVGELLVARNRFGALAEESGSGAHSAAELRGAGTAMDRVLRDLHRTAMAMRLVPVERVFRRIARVVRDTAAQLGREVDVVLEGLDARVDKTIADALFDPLLHLARNALDHGIQATAERSAVGKPTRGTLSLSARSQGSQLVVTLADDGRGIDPGVMRQLASERGLMPAEQAAELGDEEAIQLVFAAGFSSAAEVTELSGRGVGMDAVKVAVERLGGRTALASAVGEGTTVSIHLPAAAALTSVLTVRVGGERFAVPIEAVVQTARVPAAAVLPVGTGLAFALRDRTVPLLDLGVLLGLAPQQLGGERKVLVVEHGAGLVGLGVGDFSDRSEVILRPMAGLLSAVPVVAGSTVMSDGSVLFVLDLAEVIG